MVLWLRPRQFCIAGGLFYAGAIYAFAPGLGYALHFLNMHATTPMKLNRLIPISLLLAACWSSAAAAEAGAPAAAQAAPVAEAAPVAPTAPVAPAATTGSYAPAHMAAAERLVYAMGLPERFIVPTQLLLQNSFEKDPENAPLMKATMAPYLKREYTAAHLKPWFAGKFDRATMLRIATFWEGPVGKKLIASQVQVAATGEPKPLTFTEKEKQIMKRFDATSAGQAFVLAIPEIEENFAEFVRITQLRMREKFLLDLEQKLKQEAGKPAA